MKRGEAEKVLRATTWLTLAERALLSTLLQRADNDTCEIKAKYAPHSFAELARWAGQSAKSVQRGLRHLEVHGWASVERGNGRGKGSKYSLAPRTPDVACECPKGDNVSPIRTNTKGDTESAKGGHGVQQRGTFESESPQVEPQIQARTARTKEEGSSARKCDYHPDAPGLRHPQSGSYRCQQCAPHLWKESA